MITSNVWPVPGTDESLNVTDGAESTSSVADAEPVFSGVVSAGASSVTSSGIRFFYYHLRSQIPHQ